MILIAGIHQNTVLHSGAFKVVVHSIKLNASTKLELFIPTCTLAYCYMLYYLMLDCTKCFESLTLIV